MSTITEQPRFPETFGGATREAVVEAYRRIRSQTMALVAPLQTEDYVIQGSPEASPPKWHLAHTSWFFETFVLVPHVAWYSPVHSDYRTLFNSYYEGVGEYFPRDRRGTLSRPTVAEVMAYREVVDRAIETWLEQGPPEPDPDVVRLMGWGLQHEQQHQELLLMDILAHFAANPLGPAYHTTRADKDSGGSGPVEWLPISEGLTAIGYEGAAFAYDNETPRHRVWLTPARIASRPVTNREFLAFVEQGGYESPLVWLSDGWQWVRAGGRRHPRYWRQREGQWEEFTLAGWAPLVEDAPVVHVSYYEADAYARWRGLRLPRETEWEWAVTHLPVTRGDFMEAGYYHPRPVRARPGHLCEGLGGVWEWTQSAYAPYPGYTPPPGALAEYNGKFMSGQYVLRGGSVVTPASHIRPTYRNFFPPDATWAFSGIRLVEDIR